jgi:hypothetical protein
MGSSRVIQIALIMGIAGMARLALAADPAEQPAPAAESSAPDTPSGRRSEVIITGERAELAKKIGTFVDQVTDFHLGDPALGMARWQDSVCPLVSGLPKEQGEYILARVSDIAQAAGAPLAGEHCHSNLFILVTNHPQEFLRDMAKRHREEVFGAAEPSAVDNFIATTRPVRTWYDTVQRTPEGLPLLTMSFPGVSDMKVVAVSGGSIKIPVRPMDSSAPLTNSWSEASHLTLNVVWAIAKVFVIVDPTRFKGVSLGQLADFVAMAGLAQVKLDTSVGEAPSILTLFDTGPQAAPPGMTDWDRAFLKSVYATEQKSILQRSNITQNMVRTIAPR